MMGWQIKAAAAGLLLAALLGVGWYVNDHAYNRGAASRQPAIDALSAQVAIDASTLAQVNKQAAANLALAQAQQSAAQAAIEQATSQARTTADTLKVSLDRYSAAMKTADCASAKVKLCAALLPY